MKAPLVVCAESYALDEPTGRLSLFHIMDQIAPQTFPIIIPALVFVVLLERTPKDQDEEECAIRISLDGTDLATLPLQVSFRGRQKTRSISGLHMLALPAPGQLVFSIEHNGASLGQWETTVLSLGVQLDQPSLGPSPEAPPPRATRPTAPRRKAS